jgi:hypothetical protein
MKRDYTQFEIDHEIKSEALAKIKNTIDAILDGGYGVLSEKPTDRVHLALCICKDMEIMYFRGFTDGMTHSSKEWKDVLGRAGRITEKS